MLLKRTIRQLAMTTPPEQASERGALGYIQWLGSLPADADYCREAMRAYEMAEPLRGTAPAIAVFCDLLVASTGTSLEPLDLALPGPRRRGGAGLRRSAL